jgi:MSHA biogenesis protein MshJ
MRLDKVNQQIKELRPDTTEAIQLEQVLVHLLRRHEGLTLVRTSVTTPDGAVVPRDAVVAKAFPFVGAVVPAAPFGSARQGLELTVSGPYPELTRYVQALEKAMPSVRWDAMNLKSEKLPPELTLRLSLVRVSP